MEWGKELDIDTSHAFRGWVCITLLDVQIDYHEKIAVLGSRDRSEWFISYPTEDIYGTFADIKAGKRKAFASAEAAKIAAMLRFL